MRKRWIKYSTFIMIVLFLSILFACDSLSIASSNKDSRSFWVPDFTKDFSTDNTAWSTIQTFNYSSTERADIYVEKGSSASDEYYQEISDAFTSTIYPTVTNHFGKPYDLDGNSKITIVFYHISDGSEKTGIVIGGYFNPIDFYDQTLLTENNIVGYSNEADIIYINDNSNGLLSTDDVKKIIAHEFQHLVNFSEKVVTYQADSTTDTWIDEGLAESAAHLCYGELSSRIKFINQNSDYIKDGYSLYYWPNDERALLNYSLSYLFFQYLSARSALGSDIFSYIVQSKYSNYDSLYYAILQDSELTASVWGNANSKRLSSLIARWMVTNTRAVSGSLYNYNSDITTLPNFQLGNTGALTMFAGGAVVQKINSFTSYQGSSYTLLHIDNNGIETIYPPSNDIHSFTEGYVAAVNSEYTTNGSTKTLTVTSKIASPSMRKTAAPVLKQNSNGYIIADPIFKQPHIQ